MCARSQESGDISGDTWRAWSSGGTGSTRARLRRRAASRASTISGLPTTSGDGEGARRVLVETVVGGAASTRDVAVVERGGRIGGGGVDRHAPEGVERRCEALLRCGVQRG